MTRREWSRRRLAELVPLLAMASTSSALNLSQFQVITSNQIPKRCIRAYQSDIEGCTRSDFTNGRQCSSSCAQGLQETANLINEACGDLQVSPRSLLGIVLSGSLIDTLCPGLNAITTTLTVRPSSTKGFITITPTPTTTRGRTTTESTSTTTLRNTTPTRDQSTSQSTTTSQYTTTSSDRETTSSSSEISSSTSSPSTNATPIQSTVQSTVTSGPAQSTPPDDNDTQEQAPEPFIGGSPFDPAPIQSLGTLVCSGYGTAALIGAISAIALILR